MRIKECLVYKGEKEEREGGRRNTRNRGERRNQAGGKKIGRRSRRGKQVGRKRRNKERKWKEKKIYEIDKGKEDREAGKEGTRGIGTAGLDRIRMKV